MVTVRWWLKTVDSAYIHTHLLLGEERKKQGKVKEASRQAGKGDMWTHTFVLLVGIYVLLILLHLVHNTRNAYTQQMHALYMLGNMGRIKVKDTVLYAWRWRK